MAGCSSNGSDSGNINGNWNATLVNGSDQTTAFTFSTTFTDVTANGVTVSNFKFTSSSPCFDGQATSETGTFALSGNFNGNVTGTFGMTITTASPGTATQNVLTLSNGTVNGNTISGNWTLTGTSGCSGQGTFTINKN